TIRRSSRMPARSAGSSWDTTRATPATSTSCRPKRSVASCLRPSSASRRRPDGGPKAGYRPACRRAGKRSVISSKQARASRAAGCINDDQPYRMNVGGRRLCSIPYSGEINDLPQILRAGRSSDEFELMIRRQFDTLYREGAQSGRVMAICLHPFVIGVPHRIGALDAALAYILRHEGVWRATGSEIIEHYLASEATF